MAIERILEYSKLVGIPAAHLELLQGEEEITDDKKAELKEEFDDFVKSSYEVKYGKSNKTEKENFAKQSIGGYDLKVRKAFNKAFGLGLTNSQIEEFKDFTSMIADTKPSIDQRGESSADEKVQEWKTKYDSLNDKYVNLETEWESKLVKQQSEFEKFKLTKETEIRESNARRQLNDYYKKLKWDDDNKISLYTSHIDNHIFSNYFVDSDGTLKDKEDPTIAASFDGKPIKKAEELVDILRNQHSMIPRSNGNEVPAGAGITVPSIDGGKVVKGTQLSDNAKQMMQELIEAKKRG